MTDPAVDAAKRATNAPDDFPFPSGPTEAFALTAAREALKPVREVIEKYENLLNPWDDVGFEILDALRPLVYPPRS